MTEQELFFDILFYYKKQASADQETLVCLLREVQELYGGIPADCLKDIADTMNVKESVLEKIIKLYPSLKKSSALHHITVCTGQRCHSKEGAAVLSEVRKMLSEHPGIFRLNTKNCLKQCRTAPNIMVDSCLYPSVTPHEIPGILSSYLN